MGLREWDLEDFQVRPYPVIPRFAGRGRRSKARIQHGSFSKTGIFAPENALTWAVQPSSTVPRGYGAKGEQHKAQFPEQSSTLYVHDKIILHV